MKSYQVAALALALVNGNGVAIAKSVPSPFKLSATGEGRWTVRCDVESGNGLVDHRELHPDKAGQASFAGDKFNRVGCEYRAASDKPVTITVEGDAWGCPLPATTPGKCEQTVAPGGSGSFNARPRR